VAGGSEVVVDDVVVEVGVEDVVVEGLVEGDVVVDGVVELEGVVAFADDNMYAASTTGPGVPVRGWSPFSSPDSFGTIAPDRWRYSLSGRYDATRTPVIRALSSGSVDEDGTSARIAAMAVASALKVTIVLVMPFHQRRKPGSAPVVPSGSATPVDGRRDGGRATRFAITSS